MTTQIKTTIKAFFQSGDRPTEAQFIDFIDSCAFLAETSSQTFVADIVVSGKFTAPSATKAWAFVTNTGVPALTAGYNVSAVVDTAQGQTTIKFITPLSTAAACILPHCTDKTALATVSAVTVSSMRIDTTLYADASATDRNFYVAVYAN